MNYYKLTNEKMQTHNKTQWVLNEQKTTDGIGEPCSSSWLHCYCDPLLAILLNPIHANFKSPRLFKIKVGGNLKETGGLKFSFTEMTLLKELPLPKVTLVQRIAFAILCVKEVCKDKDWNEWADNWLSGRDRTKESAQKAHDNIWSVYKAAYTEFLTYKPISAPYNAASSVANAVKISDAQAGDLGNKAYYTAVSIAYASLVPSPTAIDLIYLAKLVRCFYPSY